MKLAAEQWQSVSRLLDEALTLPEGERCAWVERLSADHGEIKPLLAEIFAQPASVATADLLSTLPSFAPSREEPQWSAATIVGPYRLLRGRVHERRPARQ